MISKIAIFVSGNGTHLPGLTDSAYAEIVAVVCNNPQAPAVAKAKALGLEVFCLDHLQYNTREEWECRVEEYLLLKKVELIVLAGFMRILSPSFVKKRPKRIINVHPSLLPSFPGRDAIQQALDYGVRVTGATLHFVDEGVDTGSIIRQTAVPVPRGLDKALVKKELRVLIQQAEAALLQEALVLACWGCIQPHR